MSTKKLTVSSLLVGSLFGSVHGGHCAFVYGPLEPRIKLHKFDEFLEEKEIDDCSVLSEKKRFLASRSIPIRAGPLHRSRYAGQALANKIKKRRHTLKYCKSYDRFRKKIFNPKLSWKGKRTITKRRWFFIIS